MFQIKICGVTRANDAKVATKAGADAIGLNFYQGSSRFVNKLAAQEIARAVRPSPDSNDSVGQPTPQSIKPVKVIGVFVNATVDYVTELVRECELDAIQLHGDESASFAWRVAEETGVPIIRAFALQKVGAESVVEFCNLPEAEKHVAAVLIDSALPGQFGGTGITADWGNVADLVQLLEPTRMRVILAGGLTPENVGTAIEVTKAAGVDVASGVESAPGIKQSGLIVRFVDNAREHFEV